MNKSISASTKLLSLTSRHWLLIFAFPCAFGLGIFGTQNLGLSLIVIALVMGLLVFRMKFRTESLLPTTSVVRFHWPSFFFPWAIALQMYSQIIFVLVLILLIAGTLLQRGQPIVNLHVGPLMLLFASTVIAFRTENPKTLIASLLIFTLIYRLIKTVKTQDLVRSTINGYGFYCFANVAAFYAGLTSPSAAVRIGGLTETSGFTRVIFPFSENLNSLPILAAFVCLAVLLSLTNETIVKNRLRYVWLTSAVFILYNSGNRSSAIILALLLLLLVIPIRFSRLTANLVTPFAIISSILLPLLSAQIAKVAVPLSSLLSSKRDALNAESFSFQGRTVIWERSVEFWRLWINEPFHQLFGYGLNGQNTSGATQAYADLLRTISLNYELSTVHNSFLQQLYNGGLVGVIFFASSSIWALRRLSSALSSKNLTGLITCSGLIMLHLFGTQEALLAPSNSSQPFWALAILIAISCQIVDRDEPAGFIPQRMSSTQS
jgi:O-antigen ligase